MKTKVINIIKYGLLLLVALPVFSVFVFQLRQKAVQHHMKEELEKQLLQTITISENDVHWAKSGKELWLNNRMFDVKSYKNENGAYIFTGLYDDEETILVHQVQKNQQQESTSGNKIIVQLLQLFPATFERSEEKFLTCIFISRQFPDSAFPLCSYIPSIITPPPQI